MQILPNCNFEILHDLQMIWELFLPIFALIGIFCNPASIRINELFFGQKSYIELRVGVLPTVLQTPFNDYYLIVAKRTERGPTKIHGIIDMSQMTITRCWLQNQDIINSINSSFFF